MAEQMRQFEVHELPKKVKAAFFEYYSDTAGNDCWVRFDVEAPDPEYPDDQTDEYVVVATWLRTQGINDGESVLIEHMW